ncbi:hypothetical protein KKC08_05990, partial [Patescibacteria group bacterium]|nr:hypothetical protein [Patescibacteria group bacterium]
YNWQIKAIAMNPNLPKLRRIYSQTNLALVRSLSEKAESLTEEERQKISILTQQAVREAKTAVNLDNRDAESWVNLAGIYRQFAGGVEGAADWAYDSYSQAILLDPTNSSLKLDLGGLLFAAEKYEEADRMFEEAVVDKRDFANGWYNWAYSAKKRDRLSVAVARMNQVLALIPLDSADYETAEETLNEWRSELERLTEQERARQEAVADQQQKEEEVVAKEVLTTPMPLPTVIEEEVIIPTPTPVLD